MNGIIILTSILGVLIIGGAAAVNAISPTPSDKQICKIAGISDSDCIKVVQERAATEAANKLALSKIIPKTANYVIQIITGDSTSWSGSLDLADINGTGNQTYTQ
jgi:hypothetical protein